LNMLGQMISQIYSETWRLYKKNFWTYVFISLVPILLIVLGTLVSKISFWVGGILIILGSFFAFFSQPAILYASSLEKKRKFSNAYLLGVENIFSYVWIMLETIFASLIYGFVVIAVALLSLYLFDKLGANPSLSAKLFNPIFYIYVAAILIPVFVYYSKLIFAPFIMVDEGSRGAEALAKSLFYSKDWWWKALAAIIAGLIPFALLSLLIYIYGQSHELPSEILSSFLYLLGTPFLLVYLFSLYRFIKSKKGKAPDPSPKQKWKILARVLLGAIVFLYFYFSK
jgi:hypothetical protein